jgi:hypothetical protein
MTEGRKLFLIIRNWEPKFIKNNKNQKKVGEINVYVNTVRSSRKKKSETDLDHAGVQQPWPAALAQAVRLEAPRDGRMQSSRLRRFPRISGGWLRGQDRLETTCDSLPPRWRRIRAFSPWWSHAACRGTTLHPARLSSRSAWTIQPTPRCSSADVPGAWLAIEEANGKMEINLASILFRDFGMHGVQRNGRELCRRGFFIE